MGIFHLAFHHIRFILYWIIPKLDLREDPMLKHRQHHVLLFDCSFCHAHTTNYMKFYLVVYFQRFRWISYQDFFSAFCKCNSNKSYKMTHRIWIMFYESYNKSRSFRKHSHDIWNDKNFLILFRSQNKLFRRQWHPSFRIRLLRTRIRKLEI